MTQKTPIEQILQDKNLTAYQISKITGTPRSSVQGALNRPVEKWTIQTLNTFAIGLGFTPGELLDILQDNYKVKYNDNTLTIQNCKIDNSQLYFTIKNAVLKATHLNSYTPTQKDIENLVKNYSSIIEKAKNDYNTRIKDKWLKNVAIQLING